MRSLSVLGPGASEVYCAHQEKDEFHCDPRARMMDGWARRRVLPALEPRDWRLETLGRDGTAIWKSSKPGLRGGVERDPSTAHVRSSCTARRVGRTGRCHCYCCCH